MVKEQKILLELENALAPLLANQGFAINLVCNHHGKEVFSWQSKPHLFNSYFDLASLTKNIFTTTAIMVLMERKKLKMDTKVHSILPWWPQRNTKVVDLLGHRSSLLWWHPFFQEISLFQSALEKRSLLQKELRVLGQKIKKESMLSVYSDCGFLLLGLVIEELFNKSLPWVLIELQNIGVLPQGLHFNLMTKRKNPLSFYIPTIAANEDPCLQLKLLKKQPQLFCVEKKPSKHRLDGAEFCLRGIVHDENAFALGGAAGHAGLFGSIHNVQEFLLFLRAVYLGQNRGAAEFLSQSLVKRFFKRAVPPSAGDWAHGWMLPSPGGASSSGHFFSPQSVGHTGFTGTSMWWDLKKDFQVVILSNRVYLGRRKTEFAKLRPQLHDILVQGLGV